MIVERSTPDCSAAPAIVYSPRTRLSQISYFSLGDKNRLPRRPRGPVPLPLDCGSLIFARSWKCPTDSQMRTDYRREVWREVRRKPPGGFYVCQEQCSAVRMREGWGRCVVCWDVTRCGPWR